MAPPPVPELPEVETIAAGVNDAARGRRVTGVRVPRPDVLREVTSPAALGRRLRGATIERARRRAKHVVIELDSEDALVVQPRFTGKLLVTAPGSLAERDARYVTVRIALDDGRALHYVDVRRLGTVTLLTHEGAERYFGALGVEPLSGAFTPDVLERILRASRQPVKKVLMDQYRIVGVGNIYANEALWRAGIDPSRAASAVQPDEVAALHGAVVGVLSEAIAARGTSFRDYRDASGEEGGFVHSLAVYGRSGRECRRCGANLVGTHAIDGRQTVLCVRCQR